MPPKTIGLASIKPIILSILSQKDSYGYEIIKHAADLSEGGLNMETGQLYPILRSLEKEGLIESYWHQPEKERKRRYYTLTAKGKEALEDEKRQWLKMHAALTRLWGGELSLT